MTRGDDQKAVLKRYLQRQRDAVVWKLDGLSERQARWPVTPTGTNLLGLVKHLAHMEYGYFGDVFDRPATDPLLLDLDVADENDDFWARADEPLSEVVAFYRRAWAHADATIDALPLDATGTVPWWPDDRRHPTLHTVLVHQVHESARHAGHADILRELLDGSAGMNRTSSNLPDFDEERWAGYRAKLQGIAEQFPG
ncbi:DinB family protein [Gryllotalpicola daejeonensis]|uniref:DinB family protein n=1 Tax=Gryllotalpicola daejeonensis TaxID=993087 RepID=A0ABP7ZHX6_9MICO